MLTIAHLITVLTCNKYPLKKDFVSQTLIQFSCFCFFLPLVSEFLYLLGIVPKINGAFPVEVTESVCLKSLTS